MSEGVLYVGVGEEYVAEAEYAAESLNRTNGDVSVSIVTDCDVDSPQFDNVIEAEYTEGWMVKIGNMRNSPYDRTLYLDTDTYVAGEITDVFDLLDRFDVAVAPKSNHFEREGFPMEAVPRSFPSVQAGVFAYRDTAAVEQFFDAWEAAYEAGDDRMHDQFYLRKVLYESALHVSLLPFEYNCTYGTAGQVSGFVRIFHGRPTKQLYTGVSRRRDIEVTPTRRELMEEVVGTINGTDLPRVFYPTEEGLEMRVHDSDFHRYHSTVHHPPLTLKRLVSSIRRNGLRTTAVRGGKELLQALKRRY